MRRVKTRNLIAATLALSLPSLLIQTGWCDPSVPAPGPAPADAPTTPPKDAKKPSQAPQGTGGTQQVKGKEEKKEDKKDDIQLAGDVSPEQMKKIAIHGITIAPIYQKDGDSSTPVVGARLRGTMFAACADKFEITNTISGDSDDEDETLKTKDGIGFRIADPTGEGFACVASMKGKKCTNVPQQPNTCVAISTHFPGATMDLSGYKKDSKESADLKIGFFYATADDLDVEGGAHFSTPSDGAFEYKNPAKIQADAAAAAAEAKKKFVDAHLETFANCLNTIDNIPIAEKALAALKPQIALKQYLEMRDKLKEAKEAAIKAKKLKELADLNKRVKGVKDAEDAEEIDADLTAYADKNQDADTQKKIAGLRRDLAANLVKISGTNSNGYAVAREIVQNAAKMDGATAAQKSAMKQDAMKYQVGGLQAQAKKAAAMGMSLNIPATTYYSVASEAREQYMDACSSNGTASMFGAGMNAGSSSGTQSNGDDCLNAFQTAQAITQLPQYYQQAVVQNYQMQQSLNGNLNGSLGGNALGGGNNGSVFAQAGPFSSSYGVQPSSMYGNGMNFGGNNGNQNPFTSNSQFSFH